MGKSKIFKASGGATKGKYGAAQNQGGQKAVRTLLTANTNIGQHFLKNPAVVESICQKANLKKSDVTLEIGPGTGNLTVRLLELSKKVIAVEFDHRMVREVLKRVEGTSNENNLQVIQGDVLKVDIPAFDVCVANLPYQISSPFLFKMLEHTPAFRCAVVMFQLEFAQRLIAKPGDDLYCRLSVNTQLLARVESVLKVGKANFRPPPKVDSMVVRIEIRKPRPAVDFKEWDGLIRLLFNRKHKTIRSLLVQKTTLSMLEENVKTHQALTAAGSSSMDVDIKAMVEDVLVTEGYGDKRAAKLDNNDFLCLLAAFNMKGIHFA
jgi:18S rRNA (adenine1779-N6/adenine1780-N6)-dimethyltransferase